jgi:hypothetical protein
MGHPDEIFDSWKTWKHGAPELGVEIVSDSDTDHVWQDKLDRYQEAGFEEVVRFDACGLAGHRLRVWDRLEDDLVERVVQGDRTRCGALGLWWVVVEGSDLECELRLARDSEGRDLLQGPEEKGRAEGEARGRTEGVRDAARRLIASGVRRDEVARLLGIGPGDF